MIVAVMGSFKNTIFIMHRISCCNPRIGTDTCVVQNKICLISKRSVEPILCLCIVRIVLPLGFIFQNTKAMLKAFPIFVVFFYDCVMLRNNNLQFSLVW
jgi:hypothetical protein